MKTAEKYLHENEITSRSLFFERAKVAINQARKECLEEAAKKVTEGTYVSNHDKEAILNLIKELL